MIKLKNNPLKPTGSALLSALFIMTLVAIAATAMTMRLHIDIYKTRTVIQSDKLYLASQAVTFWAMGELKDKNQHFQKARGHGLVSQFPSTLSEIYPGLKISGQLIDLQSKFNINNLQDKKYIPVFRHLTEVLLKKTTEEKRKNLGLAIHDWLSDYQPAHGKDRYLSAYLSQKPAYQPAHLPMSNLSELRLVLGVNPAIYQQLAPYLIALPEKTALNINTAPKVQIMALGNGLTEAQTAELMILRGEDREERRLQAIQELINKFDIPTEQITTDSSYFLSIATVRFEQQQLTNYSILKRSQNKKNKNNKITVSLISESLNSPP